MKPRSLVLAGWIVLAAQSLGLAQTPGKPDQKFSEKQRDALKQLEKSLQAFPVTPVEREQKLQAVRERMRALLSANGRPAPAAVDDLAGTLALGLNEGVVTIENTLGIAKELTKVLDLPVITADDTRNFTNTIDPYVTSMNLTGPERARVYREALLVVISSPTYVYNQR